jgi:ABC-type amino acid transport substrate-binding protein
MVLSVLTAFVSRPAASADPVLAPDMARILAAGELRIATYAGEFPPFFSTAGDGSLVGLDVELARDLAAKLGVRPTFVRTANTWDESVELVFRGEADVGISALSRTLARARRVAFTRPYLTLHQTLLVNRLRAKTRDSTARGPEGLDRADARVGALAGTSFVEFLQLTFPAARRRTYERWEAGVASLLDGGIDALMGDEITTRRTLADHPEYGLRLRLVVLARPDPIVIAVHWRDRQLLHWLNLYLEMAAERGFLEELQRRYLQRE